MKNIVYSIFVALAIALFSYLSYNAEYRFNFIKNIWNYVDDIMIYWLNYLENKHNDKIVIIKIDDKTFNELWRSDLWMVNFDKGFYADIIEILIEYYKVSVIWIDIIFANRSILWKEDELKLKLKLDKYWDKIVLAARSDYTPHNLCMYNNTQHWIIELIHEERIRSINIHYPEYDISKLCDEDEFKILEENKNWVYSFPIEVFKKYIDTQNIINQHNLKNNLYNNLEKQHNKNNSLLINFFHNWKNNSWTIWYESYSLIDIYNKKDLDLSWKIVLIWEVWTLIHDSHHTPISTKQRMPWVEIHANAINTMLLEKYLYYPNKYLVIFYLFILNIIVIYFIFKFNIIINLLLIAFIFIGNIFISTFFYTNWIIFSFFLHIYSAILITFISTYLYKYIVTDKAKRYIKKAFWMYVSKDIVEEIAKDPSKLNLKWENKNISIFFSDIVWFTSISEKMTASDLFHFLNEYLDEMTKILNKNEWTLDKYIWDAIMWFFNAPLDIKDHEYKACLTAIEQQKALKKLNKKWKEKKLPNIWIRIWIHTWEAMHGNLWSMWERINYTIIWDSVNLAARLESICKYYWVEIIISKSTHDKVKDKFITRPLDKIAVKWKEEAVEIYELIWLKWDRESIIEKYKYIKLYKKWLEAYYNWEYEYAIKVLSNNKWDLPSQLLKTRCKDLLTWKIRLNNWVFTMTSK